LFLTEGHSYFITVKVCTLNVLIVKWSRFMLLCTCVQEKGGRGSTSCICNISLLES
jgi:hypothetical protein